MIFPLKRCNSIKKPLRVLLITQGSILVKKIGVYRLIFDNSYSMLRSKIVNYSINTLELRKYAKRLWDIYFLKHQLFKKIFPFKIFKLSLEQRLKNGIFSILDLQNPLYDGHSCLWKISLSLRFYEIICNKYSEWMIFN